MTARAPVDPAYLSPFDNTVKEPAEPVSNTKRVLLPTDDTYVRGGGTAGTNYQSSIELKVGEGGGRAFFKFDLSSLAGGTITQAQLELVPIRVFAPGAVHTVDFVPDDTWVEGSVNFNNQPAINSAVFTTNFTAPAPGALATINVTSVVQGEFNSDPGKKLSLRIGTPITAETRYSSKEGIVEFMPVLRVTGTFPPVGGTVEVIVDNAASSGVIVTGGWARVYSTPGFYGPNLLHDANSGKGGKSVRFTPTLPSAGTYQVYGRWVNSATHASNTPFTITHAAGSVTVNVDQRTNGGVWVLLGTYAFNAGTGGNVLISNTGTTSTVIADAVRFVRP